MLARPFASAPPASLTRNSPPRSGCWTGFGNGCGHVTGKSSRSPRCTSLALPSYAVLRPPRMRCGCLRATAGWSRFLAGPRSMASAAATFGGWEVGRDRRPVRSLGGTCRPRKCEMCGRRAKVAKHAKVAPSFRPGTRSRRMGRRRRPPEHPPASHHCPPAALAAGHQGCPPFSPRLGCADGGARLDHY